MKKNSLFSYFSRSAKSNESTKALPTAKNSKKRSVPESSNVVKNGASASPRPSKTPKTKSRDQKFADLSAPSSGLSKTGSGLSNSPSDADDIKLASVNLGINSSADGAKADPSTSSSTSSSTSATTTSATTITEGRRRSNRSGAQTKRRYILDDSDEDEDEEYEAHFSSASSRSSSSKKNKRKQRSFEESEDEFDPEDEMEVSDRSDDDDGLVEENDDWLVDDEEESPIKNRKRERKKAAPAKKRTKKSAAKSSNTPFVAAVKIQHQQNSFPSSSSSSSSSSSTSSDPHDGGRGNSSTKSGPPIMFRTKAREGLPPAVDDGSTLSAGEHWHNYMPWLYEDRRDKNGHTCDHPDYNPTTLKIPSFKTLQEKYKNNKKVTPAMQQWWEIKRDHFDCVLFFKVGKFYELFHMDADVGVRVLQTNGIPFIYMRNQKAHAGFPEISYGKFSSILVEKGYKVARVEQVEKASDVKGIVKREIVSILTPGTRTHTYLDPDIVSGTEPSYLFTVTERPLSVPTSTSSSSSSQGLAPVCEYGVCYVDSTTGSFKVGCFADGPQRNRLRTLLAKIRPKEVVYPHGIDERLSEDTMSILRAESHPDAVLTPQGPLVDVKKKKRKAWDPKATIAFFKKVYEQIDSINAEEEKRSTTEESARAIWPWVMQQMVDTNSLAPIDACSLAWSAVGGLVAHLEKCYIAFQLLDHGTFDAYVPGDLNDSVVPVNELSVDELSVDEDGDIVSSDSSDLPAFMTLDVHAIRNLEIFENTYDRGSNGTLFEFLDKTQTPMGKRLFRSWLVNPLCRPSTIYKRLDAVDDLCELSNEVDTIRTQFKNIPDLEKLENAIHALGSKYLDSDHPAAKAVMYEEEKYLKKKYEDYHKALEGFEKCQKYIEEFVDSLGDYELKSSTLIRLLNMDRGGPTASNSGGGGSSSSSTKCDRGMRWPNLTSILQKLRKIAPPKPSKTNNYSLTIKPGDDPELDRLKEEEKDINNKLVSFLKNSSKELRCPMKYFGKNKNSWQIEVSDKVKVPNNWIYNSKKKGYKRYYTKDIQRWKMRLDLIAEGKEKCNSNRLRTLFRTFSRSHKELRMAIKCIARLDALISLASASENIQEGADGCSDQPTCRPEFVSGSNGAVLELRDARHPCIAATFSGNGFIPNDTILGSGTTSVTSSTTEKSTDNANANCLLLTGPNMGGKSTVLRQTCICIIMAQLGCKVPAKKCRLSPVDRIFTRIGASDNILDGQSTFFVELSETSTILHEATPNSLVILDELGRGTSTFDGVAIASAVVQKLAEDLTCRTMFATHYHSLVDEFSTHPNVAMANMACKVADDGDININDPNYDADSNVMFLYKLIGGACTKSYGLNVARLARLPQDVLNKARLKSKEFEETMISVAKESLMSGILRLVDEIKENGLTPSLEKKLITLHGQAKTVAGKH